MFLWQPFLGLFYLYLKFYILYCLHLPLYHLIYKRGEERKSVIFIIKGELEIGATITLKEINDLINSFGGIMNEKYMRDLLNSYEEFNKYFLKHKHKIKLKLTI